MIARIVYEALLLAPSASPSADADGVADGSSAEAIIAELLQLRVAAVGAFASVRRHVLVAATSAQGLGSPLPHLRRDWARRCHICAGLGVNQRMHSTAAVHTLASLGAKGCVGPIVPQLVCSRSAHTRTRT